ncbi:MAG: IPT/TIG domain-containing protein, partial [Holophagales bacterium]|nr:IPT/TIG domain-containing protein [Holophagales bacterium]
MLLAVALGACSADDPTAPTQPQAVPPPPPSDANATWNITVTANPDSFDINQGAGTAQIEVTARRADNGARVATGTTALLSTTVGTLTTPEGSVGDSVPIQFDAGGVARATLTTGAVANPGTGIVRARIEDSFGSVILRFLDVAQPPFQLSSVSPTFGPPSGGTRVSINGSGFESPVRVTFLVNGLSLVAGDARVSSSSRISATTPPINLAPGQNAVADILVENAFDANGNPTAVDTLQSSFTYTRSSGGATTLKVISVTPSSGPNEGGTQVTILGEAFPQNPQVYFTTTALVEATVLEASATRLEVITPSATGQNSSNANSFVDVLVRDPVSGQEGRLVNGYQYGTPGGAMFISSLRPNEDEYVGGTLVTVFGQGFDEPVAVEMGGQAQQVISVSGTEVVVRSVAVQIGCSPQTGNVQVTNIETAEGATGPAFAYFPVEPLI